MKQQFELVVYQIRDVFIPLPAKTRMLRESILIKIEDTLERKRMQLDERSKDRNRSARFAWQFGRWISPYPCVVM
jgi:hypothetical protein